MVNWMCYEVPVRSFLRHTSHACFVGGEVVEPTNDLIVM